MSDKFEFDDDELAALLADESMWVEPDPSLEDRVVGAIEGSVVDLGAAREQRTRSRWTTVAPWIAAAAAILSAVVVAARPFNNTPTKQYAASLHGTPLAQDARADAGFTNRGSGVEIRLHMHNLARAPDGSFYEAWVKGPNGLVPIGTFHTGGDNIVLWAGVDVSQYPQMTVTLEPEDGNPASSGRQVLAGPITHS